jgi:hypothetical protein
MYFLKDFTPTLLTLGGVLLSTLGALLFSLKTILDNIQTTNVNDVNDVNDVKDVKIKN